MVYRFRLVQNEECKRFSVRERPAECWRLWRLEKIYRSKSVKEMERWREIRLLPHKLLAPAG
jgi:hypothetical protein